MKFNKPLQQIALATSLSVGFAGVALAADSYQTPAQQPSAQQPTEVQPAQPKPDSAGALVQDSVITAKIKADFLADKLVGAARISVETVNGTVMLSGYAKSAAEIERAQELAAKVDGVKVVKNDIQLQSSTS